MSPSNGGTATPAAGIPAPLPPLPPAPAPAPTSGTPTEPPTPPAPSALRLSVRYFAGAAAAAGRDEEQVTMPAGARLADLVTSLHHAHAGRLDRVLAASSFLVDGVSAGPELRLRDGVEVDVLPPFAGG